MLPRSLLLLLLLLRPAPGRRQQHQHHQVKRTHRPPAPRYRMTPTGAYYYTSNPRRIYQPRQGVCVVEEVPDVNITFPFPWTQGTFCTHPTSLRQRCCEGHEVAALEHGCPVVRPVRDVLTTSKDLRCCQHALHLLQRHRLPDLLTSKAFALTLLLPQDEGFRSLANMTASELERVVLADRWYVPPLLLYHALPRRWYTSQLHHGQRLPTLYQQHALTVTKLSNKMVLVNCLPLQRVDVHARDGVVHVLPRPLHPAYTSTLADLVTSDPNLTSLFAIIGYADLLEWLRRPGPLTLLAPTNAAFTRLPRRYLDSITYDVKYFPALQGLARQHLTEGLECSLGLRTKARLETLEGHWLPVGCSASLALTVGPATLVTPDVLASNGVLHYIDRVLIPPMALSLVQVARRAGATRYVQLIRKVGLFQDLVSFGPYTIFAPSNRALRGLKSSLLADREALRHFVLYHLVQGAYASFTLRDNQVLPSRLPRASLRIKIHPKVVSVEDGVVVSGDHVAFNGYVHVVDRLLTPPTRSLAQVLALTPALSRFTALITQAGVWMWRELSRGEGPYTLLAVRDHDMDTWAADTFTYWRIITDQRLLNQSLKTHLLEDFVMPRALQEGSTSLLTPRHASRTLRLTLARGHLSLHHASLSREHVICTNGIILFTDSLLLP
ncbi:LOW QUALITY PROTEIN: transforming growth factor-beta-induced protein ig-h3-like [Panulirus ornatus]|uniref:LOW QUALITY PROTEIN: transforming growth factor-beta-induced protein ig-h3-like n=1 Tax=Panulirus ornatus TaxID=150431 RepID=UPI003A88E846